MLKELTKYLAAGLLAATPMMVAAQPVAVEGTKMIPNEYGSEFPQEIIWQADGSEMVLIPFGTFTRGLSAERGGSVVDSPEATISLPSFYISKYEVTNQQYAEFLRLSGRGMRPAPAANPDLQKPEHPVSAIPWNSADEYARWTDRQLPTEAMWEKAARGPEGFVYTTGNTLPSRETVITRRGPQGATVPAKQNTGDVSPYGVYHMNGNVSEFVSDWFDREYYRVSPTDDPQGPTSGDQKSVRGASFTTMREGEIRTTFRYGIPRGFVRDEIGFRTAWIPRPVEAQPEPTPTPTPVPVASRADLLGEFIATLTPHFEKNTPQLPSDMMAPRALLGTVRSDVQFINYSPYAMTLAFVHPTDKIVYVWGEPLPAMTFRNVTLPADIDMNIIAYAPNAPSKGPKNIGSLRSESRARIMVVTEQFGPVVNRDGSRIEVLENPESNQYYRDVTPQWNTFEVLNNLDEEIIVKIEDLILGESGIRTVGEFTIEASETLRLTLNPGQYRASADYFGAAGDSSTPRDFRLDDRAARRLLTLEYDREREGGVTVVTQRKPYLKIDVTEARAIALPPAQATPTQQRRR